MTTENDHDEWADAIKQLAVLVPRRTPVRYLDLRGLAARAGITYERARHWRGAYNLLPPADAVLGEDREGTTVNASRRELRGWLSATVDAWLDTEDGRRATMTRTETTTTTTTTEET